MSYQLTAHLAQNLAVLEQEEYVDPETGKTKRLKDSGAVWLKVLLVICNAAGDSDRQYYGGWRYLAAQAGTNTTLATEKVRLFEQLGWLKPLSPRRLEAGMRGKPAQCWEVTLPNLPPMVQTLWQAPEKPAEQVASVQPIDEAKSKRHRRKSTGTTAALSTVLGSVVASVVPITHPEQAQPLAPVVPALPKEVAALLEQAKQIILLKANSDPALSAPQKLSLVAQAEGSWQAPHRTKQVGKVMQSPTTQVATLLREGLVTDAEAVRWLASQECTYQTLRAFIGLPEN